MTVAFLHLRDKTTPRGGLTIAYDTNEDTTDEDKKVTFVVATAHCHPKDNFCRRTGRAKAGGRLKSDKCRTHITSTRREIVGDLITIFTE